MNPLIFAALAFATTGYDPTSPVTVFDGDEIYDQDMTVKLWSEIELHADRDTTLFAQENFLPAIEWVDASYSPWIATMFGSSTPKSNSFLLHAGVWAEVAEGTPILMVPGAGDNGSRGFITIATKLDRLNRPVFALTFAHPHGDVFMQAEVVADAIARIKERTGASQVDVVSHSKGGLATATYLSHTSGAEWGDEAYESVGTPYRGDVRRAVFIASPLGGIDTGFRWTNGNYASLDADTALSPSSWSTYYPYTTGNLAVSTDLSEQDFLPEDGDAFPGHRQLLARQSHDLPGESPWLGAYSVQQDWFTTYEGGYGYYSNSPGIDDVIEAGGDFIETLAAQGVDPDVELFLLAGSNPLMPNGTWDYAVEVFGEEWTEMAEASADDWGDLVAAAYGDALIDADITEGELSGLAAGDLTLGEISGPSDGLVFLDSALAGSALTARGAVIVEAETKDLSHLDLLYASDVTGELLIEAGNDEGEEWMVAVGERYAEENSLGWLVEVLADEETSDTEDTDSTDTDSESDTEVSDTDDSTDETDPGARLQDCAGCSGTGVPMPLWLGLFALVGLRRQQKR